MIADIQWAFSTLVRSADWMDEDTKVATLDKAAAVKLYVGFPEWLLDKDQLQEYYEGVSKSRQLKSQTFWPFLVLRISKQYTTFRRQDRLPSSGSFYGSTALVGLGLLMVVVSRSHSDPSHSVHSSGQEIGPSQRPLFDNTQHSPQTDIHVVGGTRTRNPSKRATADPRPKSRGHWDRHLQTCFFQNNCHYKTIICSVIASG
jgi:hypothetical protein